MPSTKRPCEMWSMLPEIFATSPGLRYVLPSTRCPMRSVSVIEATAPASAKASKAGLGASLRGRLGGTK